MNIQGLINHPSIAINLDLNGAEMKEALRMQFQEVRVFKDRGDVWRGLFAVAKGYSTLKVVEKHLNNVLAFPIVQRGQISCPTQLDACRDWVKQHRDIICGQLHQIMERFRALSQDKELERLCYIVHDYVTEQLVKNAFASPKQAMVTFNYIYTGQKSEASPLRTVLEPVGRWHNITRMNSTSMAGIGDLLMVAIRQQKPCIVACDPAQELYYETPFNSSIFSVDKLSASAAMLAYSVGASVVQVGSVHPDKEFRRIYCTREVEGITSVLLRKDSVLTGSLDGTVRLYPFGLKLALEPKVEIKLSAGQISVMENYQDSVVIGTNNIVKIWDAKNPQNVEALMVSIGPISSLAADSSNHQIFCAAGGGLISQCDTRNATRTHRGYFWKEGACPIYLMLDHHYLYIAGNRSINIWDTRQMGISVFDEQLPYVVEGKINAVTKNRERLFVSTPDHVLSTYLHGGALL